MLEMFNAKLIAVIGAHRQRVKSDMI